MSAEAKKECERELKRLAKMTPASAEYMVSRTYLEWMTSLPWNKTSGTGEEAIDISKAQEILDEDHYDLVKVKQRMLDYLAVKKLQPGMKGPILCFVGPPGVGKTSLGKSIARAMGRKFVRISLGGMHDEAEIRGHRRTYIGALPGQIIQGIRRAETMDPVLMLDEVDKLGRDFRGDPSAALMEVLDPEQNSTFRDHYLDVPFDLSKVLFIATANWMDPIPEPLRDRMEVIELAGYTEEEKVHIAKRFLIPRQTKEHGLKLGEQIEFTDESLHDLIHHYTREAGVRNLEREIATLVRKQARRMAEGKTDKLVVTPEVIREALGIPKFRLEKEVEERVSKPGVSVGLVWTPVGGDIVFIEASKMRGGKGFTMTGHLGEVMQESMRAALTWVRANSDRYGIDPDFFRKLDLHVHVPSGAIPKDGPSAGVAMVTALVSLLDGAAGAAARGDDRRNFALRNRAADRRREGEGARREAGGHQGSDSAVGERAEREGRPAAGNARRDSDPLRAHGRAGSGNRARQVREAGASDVTGGLPGNEQPPVAGPRALKRSKARKQTRQLDDNSTKARREISGPFLLFAHGSFPVAARAVFAYSVDTADALSSPRTGDARARSRGDAARDARPQRNGRAIPRYVRGASIGGPGAPISPRFIANSCRRSAAKRFWRWCCASKRRCRRG